MKKNKTAILVLMLILLAQTTSAQFKLPKSVGQATQAVIELKVFLDALTLFHRSFKMATAEFNSKVTVVKGDQEDRSTSLPPGKIKPLEIKKGEIKNMEWKPAIGFEGQLFPSAIIGLAFYKGATTPELETIMRPIGIRFISKYENIPIKYEIECSNKKLFDKIKGNYLYDQTKREVWVNPVIPWNYEELAKIEASTPVTFTFRFFDNDGNQVEKAVTSYLRSVNDCLLAYDKTPLYFLSTAYIQEEHPEILKILKEATNSKIVSDIAGYQGNAQYVDSQVAAICKVLHDRSLNYSSIGTTVGNGDLIFSQSIRTFQSAIRTNQANCIDGTIVFASILRKMDIKTVMVLTDNHCFLGYYRQKDDNGQGKDLRFLETTKISNSDKIDEAIIKSKAVTDKKKAEKIIRDGYYEQFRYLIDEGTKSYNYYNSKTGQHFIRQILDVDEVREYIKPIPFTIL